MQPLDTYCLMEVMVNGQVKDTILPQPSETVFQLLELAKVQLSQKIKRKAIQAAARQKLQNHRTKCSQ